MIVNTDDKLSTPTSNNTEKVAQLYIRKYEKAKGIRQNFVPLFEECYEYALPMRESFFTESIGRRRDEKIFDETAVVGVQEFASRLQSGLVPNFAGGQTSRQGRKYRKKKGTK